jgi:putative transposase
VKCNKHKEDGQLRNIVSKTLKRFHKLFAKHIDLNIGKNAEYQEEDIGVVLAYASSENLSVQEASAQLKDLEYDVPSGDDVLHHLHKHKGKQKELAESFRKIIAGTLREAKKRRLLWKPLDIAIDFNEVPWYGKLLPFIVKGKKKEGTNKFIKFATVSIVVAGERFIVDAVPVTPLTIKNEAVKELLEITKKHDLRIRRLMVDRGFYDVSIVNMLKDDVCYLMPARRTGGVKSAIRDLEEKGEHITEYTMRNAAKETVSCTLFIVWSDEDETWIWQITF